MIALVLAGTAGVLAVHALPALPPWWTAVSALVAAAVPLAVPAVRSKPHRQLAARLLLAFAFGFALTALRAEHRLADRWPIARQGATVRAAGHVASLPELSREADGDGAGFGGRSRRPRAGEGPNTWRFVFAPLDPALPARIRVGLYRTPLALRGGDCWTLTLRLKTPHGSANPGGFDYEGWLFQQGIGATATARTAEPCAHAGFHPVLRMRERLRNRLAEWLPAHPALPLLTALVMGDDSAVSDADWQAFRHTGTTHLIAISGFNLAIVAGLVFWLARRGWPLLPRRLALALPAQQAAALVAAVAATGYALLAGFEPPVLRALLMLLVALAALFAARPTRAWHVLALAWAAIVLAEPFAVLAPGTWLSFAAVAAIVFLGTGRLAAPSKLGLLLRVQVGLGLLLAPLTLFWFQSSAGLAGLVNLLLVPWFALLTPLALVAVGVALALPALGVPLLTLVATLLEGTRLALHALAASPVALATGAVAAPSPAALLLATLGCLLLLAPRGLPPSLRALGLLCLLPLAVPPNRAPREGFTVQALDVGQGLAVLVRTREHALLFDAGPAWGQGFDAGEQVVLPALRALGVRALDVLLVSHPDLDHAGGAAAVRRGIPIRAERGSEAGTTPCVAGQSWDWDGVRFTLLNGPADATAGRSADNDGGCVLRVSTGAHAVLLPADIESAAEARLLVRWGEAGLKADVLAAPHHGSRTSSSAAFVAAVNPEVVLVGAGFANPFRHPRTEVVERYEALGSEVRMTGHEGMLTVHVHPARGAAAVTAWRERWPRYWQAPLLPLPENP